MTDITGIKYCHLGDKYTNMNGKITIASILTDQDVQYGVAYCSPKDRFKKSLGRTIATNRLRLNGPVVNLTREELNHNSIMIAILCDILETHESPSWAYETIVDHIDWYYTKNSDIEVDGANLNEIDQVMTWLDNMPEVDFGLLKVMISQYIDKTL